MITKVGTITADEAKLLEALDWSIGCDWPGCPSEATHKMSRSICGCITFYCQTHASTKRREMTKWSLRWTCLRCRTVLGPGWGAPDIARFEEL